MQALIGGNGGSGGFVAPAISTNQTNLNLRTYALANGWDGTSAVSLAIGSNVFLYSTSTATPALTISGSFPNGVSVINNGYIVGMGGNGGAGPYNYFDGNATYSGLAGGNAISLGANVSIINNGYIAGGGGGGCAGNSSSYETPGGGGGAGAGKGAWGAGGATSGGVGGSPNSAGAKGTNALVGSGGGGGGRILPGVGGIGENNAYPDGSVSGGGGGGGSGGAGGGYNTGFGTLGTGYNGGSAGSAGVNPVTQAYGAFGGGGGGGWGAMGGSNPSFLPGSFLGGAGGKAVARNGFTATITGSGTVYGSIS